MELSWDALIAAFDRRFPQGSPLRKLLQIISIVLLFEGISVVILYSKAGIWAGIFSLALGTFLLLLLYPGTGRAKEPARATVPVQPQGKPFGIILVDAVMSRVKNDYIISAAGILIILFVVAWNLWVSARPELGDMDTLAILFGGMVAVFPFLMDKFKVEASFSLIFIGLVVLFLVVPQAIGSTHSGASSSIGGWYVEYMLAAPFAGILDLIGIPASSSGSMVSITFQDGTHQVLGISAYCAGLYSFSIFLAAFFSFILVFERMPARMLAGVVTLGLVIAYLGNIVRMVIIGIVGYYRGLDALLWAHENAGWIIFLSWSAVFWYLVIRYVDKRTRPAPVRNQINTG